MLSDYERIKKIWNQRTIPVIIRRMGAGQFHRVRIPYSQLNRDWLKNSRRNQPNWLAGKRCWEIPKAWFNDFVERALKRYGKLYIIQPYRQQEVCAPACMNARGHECQCSCMGANHGMGNDGSWFEVSDAFATKWEQKEWACRLMVRR